MPRALLSVSDKRHLVDLGRGLAARGFELVSTGGTARALAEAGLTAVSVSELTGFPEMLDGRVKTLHPAVHGGILARRKRPDDLAALERQGIGLIDLVVVNLYPFAKAAANPDTPFDALVEEIDIGGPSLVRAAAKNFRDVLVVVDPDDYARLLAALDAGPTLAFRFELMRKAFAHTATYDARIADELSRADVAGDEVRRRIPHPRRSPPDLDALAAAVAKGLHDQLATAAGGGGGGAFGSVEWFEVDLQDRLTLTLEKIRDLRYGENPHQQAAWYRIADAEARQFGLTAGLGDATVLQGKELSFTNLLDLDAAARIVLEFDEPAAAVVKHTNPCGVATGGSAAAAYVRARDADRLSSFGGIVAVNRPIDQATAEAIVATKLDAVIAPAVDDPAKPVLARRPDLRIVVSAFAAAKRFAADFRSVLGAFLMQEGDWIDEARSLWTPESLPHGFRVPTRREPTVEEWRALRFAWRVAGHVKSNTVIFTGEDRTLAIGAGQMSRVDAANVAVMKARAAGISLAGSVVASDAFFPFRDGLDAVAAAGATAVVQPGGSVKDAEVVAAADEHGLAMVFTGRRHFRH